MDIQESINKIKEQILLHNVLTELDLQTLYKKFQGKVHCDEYHQHSYKCIHYTTVENAVIVRLLDEIQSQRKVMRRIGQEANKFINPELDED